MERRAEPRFHVGSKARMFLPADPRELTAHVINVSGSGLRVLISENLALGQHIVLDLEHHLVAAEACNCVSQEVSNQMAIQVAEEFRSDWGISITGYATPVPESNNKLYSYFSISYHGKIKAKGKIVPKKKQPMDVQIEYVNVLLKKISSLHK